MIGGLELGGTELHLVRTAPGLLRRGFQPVVYTLSPNGQLRSELTTAGVPVVTSGLVAALTRLDWLPQLLRRPLMLIATSATLLALLVTRRPAIVHFFLPAAYLIGGPLSLLARVPVRIMSRRSLNGYQRKRPWLVVIERWLHPRMTVLLGNSRAVIADLRSEGATPDQLRLIHNGLDPARFISATARADTRTELGVAPDALLLILVANLIPYKGHADLLDALSILRDRLPADWRLLCVGRDDGIGADLRARAADLVLDGHVHWLGQRHDVPALLAAADLGLLCSHEEGFSNAILEAMAAGLPLVVTAAGGNGEAVLDGETGFVVPVQAPDALAAAIAKLAEDGELRARFGTAGRARIERHFTIEQSTDAYAALYEAALAGTARHCP